jgi:hypothetical protein
VVGLGALVLGGMGSAQVRAWAAVGGKNVRGHGDAGAQSGAEGCLRGAIPSRGGGESVCAAVRFYSWRVQD